MIARLREAPPAHLKGRGGVAEQGRRLRYYRAGCLCRFVCELLAVCGIHFRLSRGCGARARLGKGRNTFKK